MLNDKKKVKIIITVIVTIIEFISVHMLLNKEWGLLTLLLIPVLFFLSLFFIEEITNNYIAAKSKWKFFGELALVFLFGTLFIKSFIVYIYPLSRMAMSTALIYGLGWSLVGMSITYFLKYLLIKISWKGTRYTKNGLSKYLLYCVPSIVILGVVFAIYYPGVGSADTSYIWDLIHQNSYTDTHPLMFLMLYKGLTLVWDNIAVITLFQYIICTVTFGYVVYYFSCKGLKQVWCWVIAIVLPLLPVNAFYSVMLWKDIPYSIGLMVYIIITIKILEDNYLDKNINLIKIVLLGLFVMYMRHNGFIAILGTVGLLGLYYLVKRQYKTMFKLAVIAIVLIVLFYGIKSGVGALLNKEATALQNKPNNEKSDSISYDNKTIVPSVFPTTVATQQLIFIEHYYGDTFTQEQKEKFAKYLKVDEVEAHKFKYRMGNKYGPNWEFYHKPYLTQRGIPIDELDEFWDYYFELFKQHPMTAIESYQKLTGIIWASVGYGPTAYRGYSKDRFNEYVSEGYNEFMHPIKDILDNSIFNKYGGIFVVFCRPAFYLMIIGVFCFIGFKRHKWKYLIVMSPVFLNIAGYLIVISAQDVRYFFINMLAFVVAIAYATMKNGESEEAAIREKV